MRRIVSLLAVLSMPAAAHVVPFDWLQPARAGNRVDGGVATLAWIDGADPPGSAVIDFFATRQAPRPFSFPAPDASVALATVPVTDVTNVVDVDVRALSDGCWFPYAVVSDPIDTGFHVGAGNFTVVSDRGNLAPSIWVTNDVRDTLDPDGRFTLRWEVDDDDASAVTVRAYWGLGGETTAVLASGLPVPAGGGTAQLVVDQRRLPTGEASWLGVEVRSSDGRTCDAFFQGYLFARYDAGVPDAGDAGSDAGVEMPPPPKGCGCGAGAGAAPLLLCTLLVRRRALRYCTRPCE